MSLIACRLGSHAGLMALKTKSIITALGRLRRGKRGKVDGNGERALLKSERGCIS